MVVSAGCSSTSVYSLGVDPGTRVLTIHADMVLEIGSSNGLAQQMHCYKVGDQYQIELEWWLERDGVSEERSGTAYVSQGNTAQDIAGEIAYVMNHHSGVSVATVRETQLPNFSRTEQGLMATEDVVLVEAVTLKRIKIIKENLEWREAHPGRAYLQIFTNG